MRTREKSLDGFFSVSSHFCSINIVRKPSEDSKDSNSTDESFDDESEIDNEETIFDMIDSEDITPIKLKVVSGENRWTKKDFNTKIYNLCYIQKEKTLLTDLCELNAKNITKILIDTIYKIAEQIMAEEVYIVVSLLNSKKNSIIRNFLVYGFEKCNENLFTTNPEVEVFRIEVTQEYDFVDLI